MTVSTDAEYHRLTYALGGEKSTRWADHVHVDEQGFVSFRDVETGHKRFVSANVEYIITEIEELPPGIDEHPSVVADREDAEVLG